MKQVILVPMWLGMSPGKVASQVAHVAVAAADDLMYVAPNCRIILKVPDQDAMLHIIGNAIIQGLNPVFFIDHAPTTEGTENKITAVALAAEPNRIDQVTGHLELY